MAEGNGLLTFFCGVFFFVFSLYLWIVFCFVLCFFGVFLPLVF